MATKKDVLLAYCERGLHLFPVRRDTKRPAIKDNLNQASIDIDQLMIWDKKFPDCNWAISCAKSGLVSVDVDWAHGGMEAWQSLIEKHGEPETLKATSGSGGLHYVFKADRASKYRGKIQKGLDIKYNGYILVYPSKHERTGNYYRWDRRSWDQFSRHPKSYPGWVGNLIHKDSRTGKADPTFKFGNRYLEKLVTTLKEHELDYEEWMQAGMALHAATDGSIEGLQLYLSLTQGQSYQDGDLEQAEAKWESFSDRGDGISQLSLGYLVRKKGGIVPSPQFDEDIRAFKEAKIEGLKEEMEKAGFVARGEQLVCWTQPEIVNHFNDRGYAFLASGGKAPYLKVFKSPEGLLEVTTMTEKGLKDLTEPYHFAKMRDTGTDIKIVLSPAYKEWSTSRRRKQYSKIVFKPKAKDGELNLWGEIPMKPLDGPEPHLILNFIRDSLCAGDTRKYEWLLDWLAHMIQKPHERVTVVPVLISSQGAGKGLLMDNIMAPILGGYFTAVNTSAELMARFNVKLSKKFLTFIDEATWRGNKTEDGILKRMCASPTMTVEEKYGATYDMHNYSRYLIASNNMEAVALEVGNRRYVVLEADDRYANDLEYFEPIGEAVEDPEYLRTFLGFLTKRDISNFNRFRILKGNTAGSIAKINTAGPVAMFWNDTFSENPRKIWDSSRGLDCSEAYEKFTEFSNKIKTYEKSITPQVFWAKTAKFAPALPAKVRKRAAASSLLYFRNISADELAESFYAKLELSCPVLFSPEEFFAESFEGDEIGADAYDF